MSKVIAALDTSMAAQPVLLTALALGKALGAEVEALHVQVDGDRVPRNTAAGEHVPLRTARGPVVAALVQAAEADDVLALVMGARGSPLGGKPLGSTALAVATSLTKPLVVVPPDTRRPGELRRVLVPLEGPGALSHAPPTIIALAQGTELDLVVLHVLEEESLPLFTDQPQHEHPARVTEFLRRYCPWGIDTVRLEVRVGRSEELVPLVAEQADADVIALGWAQELAPERASIVRAVLERAHVPILLVPVQNAALAAPESTTREESWSSLQSSPA
jgi:nucleotide-binding universal stress UspA family protein